MHGPGDGTSPCQGMPVAHPQVSTDASNLCFSSWTQTALVSTSPWSCTAGLRVQSFDVLLGAWSTAVGIQMSGHKGGFRSVDVRQMLSMGRRSRGPEPRNEGSC